VWHSSGSCHAESLKPPDRLGRGITCGLLDTTQVAFMYPALLRAMMEIRAVRTPVATKNSEGAEKSRVLGWAAVVSGMLKLVCSMVSVLARRFRSKVVSGTGEPRPTSPAARSSSPAAGSAPTVYDRSPALGLAPPTMATLSERDGFGQAGHRRPMAPSGLPPVLALALAIRTTVFRT
jgi:hypothetical protein